MSEYTDECPKCDGVVHEQSVSRVKKRLPAGDTLNSLAEFYKIFGDGTRIRILCILFEEELCVCDIAQLLSVSISAVSHQLRILKQSKLVKYRREGKTIFYSLADDHIKTIIEMGMEHISE